LPLKSTKAINDYLAWVAKCTDLDTTFCDVCQLLAVLEFKKIFTLNISIKKIKVAKFDAPGKKN
jgi:hypothetical protein